MKKHNISIKLLLNPSTIYVLMWIFMIFLYSLRIIDYGKLSKATYIGIIISFIGIAVGNCFAILLIANSFKSIKDNIECVLPDKSKLNKIYRYLCIMGIIGVIIAYIKVFSQISIIGFFTNQVTVKTILKRSIIAAYLSACAYVAIPIGVILGKYYNYSYKYIVTPYIISILYGLSFWSRFQMMISTIFLIFSYILIYIKQSNKKISIFKIIRVGAVVFIGVYIFMSWTIDMRVSEYGKEYNPNYMYGTNPKLYPFLMFISPIFSSFRALQMTYSYLVASLPTLDYWISMQSQYSFGEVSFPYIYRLLDKLNIVEHTNVGDVVLGGGLQLPSFIGYAYMDFGLFGIFIYSFLLASISTYMYVSYIKTNNVILIPYIVSMYSLVLMSVQTNMTSQTMFMIILLIIFVVNKSLGKRKLKLAKTSEF